ncbi:MAG: galactokinase [Oscillospiraceae bacterium]|nr:galactokinase [Oscillospiraceae bacterium]
MPDAAKSRISSGACDGTLQRIYSVGREQLAPYRARILSAIDAFSAQYGAQPVRVFSVSGRTELGGNHTDHQHGRVLAGGISLDIIAVAAKTDDGLMRIKSEGFPEDTVPADELAVRAEEAGRSAALLRGTTARFRALGKPAGGFCAYTTSNVLKGSGLSSSAAFEVMIGTICNDFFADNAFSLAELAIIAQYAENEYFMKPCGLMDQMACALGGVTAIDFADPAHPVWEQVSLDLNAEGYVLCIIDSGADHADLTDEYAAVPREMKAVAAALGKQVLQETDEAEFLRSIPRLREQCGDRAVLRAMHFYEETARVPEMTAALREQRFSDYLRLVTESGQSSAFALQNIYAAGSTRQQAVAVTIALCKKLLCGKGACRVHGGGFAGTVQAYVPAELAAEFQEQVNAVLGAGACQILRIRSCGACALWEGETACC